MPILRDYNTPDDYIQALIQQNKVSKEHLEPLLLEGIESDGTTPMTATDWDNIHAAVQRNQSNRSQNG